MWKWIKSFRIPRPTGAGLRTAALFLAAPMFAAILTWQLNELNPQKACNMGFLAAAKSADVTFLQAFNGCLGIYKDIINVRDHAIIGLLTIMGLGYMMMMMREQRMQGEFKGPLGIGGSFRQDNGQPETPADGAKLAVQAGTEVAKELENQESENASTSS